jgi:hypothetical protein
MKRAKLEGLIRNIEIVLGAGDPSGHLPPSHTTQE